MDRRTFIKACAGGVAASAWHADRPDPSFASETMNLARLIKDKDYGAVWNKPDPTECRKQSHSVCAPSTPEPEWKTGPMLPLLSIDESARLGKELGIDPSLSTANIFRGLLHSPPAAGGFHAVINALMFHNKVAARVRELIILRIGWRTGSEYVFCNHVRISRELGVPDEEILGVRDPERCRAYSKTDRALLQLADEMHECAQVTPSTWAALEKAFAPGELVELLLIAGFWRMAAGFLKSAKTPLDAGVPSWPEGRKPGN